MSYALIRSSDITVLPISLAYYEPIIFHQWAAGTGSCQTQWLERITLRVASGDLYQSSGKSPLSHYGPILHLLPFNWLKPGDTYMSVNCIIIGTGIGVCLSPRHYLRPCCFVVKLISNEQDLRKFNYIWYIRLICYTKYSKYQMVLSKYYKTGVFACSRYHACWRVGTRQSSNSAT